MCLCVPLDLGLLGFLVVLCLVCGVGSDACRWVWGAWVGVVGA